MLLLALAVTRDQGDQAVERAKRARELQSEIFEYAGRFDPEELARLGNFTTRHVAEFVKRAAMPERNGEFEYRIKSATEPHQRVVRESQLK